MRATMIYGPRDIRLEEVPDPTILSSTDAIVRVVASCVCGSDLWPYRAEDSAYEPRRIGHEFVGVVEEVGTDVATLTVGDFVIAPFSLCDGTCRNCLNGITTSCDHGAFWGSVDSEGRLVDGGQGEFVRVALADGTLVRTPETPDPEAIPHLLTLSDVMGTGHHAAISAGVSAGSVVAVVGDGAVGQCAILASRRLGAERIIAFSRHPNRQALAREFGATDVLTERGKQATTAIKELLNGAKPDSVLECVGTAESMGQAIGCTRPGGRVGYVGVPNGGDLPIGRLFTNNIGVNGGVAPVRAYLPELLDDVLADRLAPGRVFDMTLPLSDVADAYRAMDERRAIKALLTVGSLT